MLDGVPMKTLTLLRHAKSGWDDPAMRDFDRPLSAKGRRAALAIGRHLRGGALPIDRIVASPAVRVVETLEGVAQGYGAPLVPAFDKRIYLASAATLFELVREEADATTHLLLAGHNPGLEDLALFLSAAGGGPIRAAIEAKLPTGSIVVMTFDTTGWAQAGPDNAALVSFTRPRDLDPALGPDSD